MKIPVVVAGPVERCRVFVCDTDLHSLKQVAMEGSAE